MSKKVDYVSDPTIVHCFPNAVECRWRLTMKSVLPAALAVLFTFAHPFARSADLLADARLALGGDADLHAVASIHASGTKLEKDVIEDVRISKYEINVPIPPKTFK
jgi:hypothetical protein